MLRKRTIYNGIGILTAVAALGCTYDFDRFESPGAASSGGTTATGGTGTGGGGKGGASAGGSGQVSAGGASGEEGLGGETGGGAVSGEGGAAGFSCSELGGKVHDGNCYFAIAPGTGLSWGSARETCEKYSPSSHLATIGSDQEQAAIEAALSPSVSDYWIGLSLANIESEPDEACDDEPESCPFEWVTGDALSYANWGEYSESDVEPNYTGACVRLQLDGFAWADYDCSTRLPALCEHDN